MESNYIENIRCEECGNKDSVGVYLREDNSYYGNCFSITCKKYIPFPYGDNGSPTEAVFKDQEDKIAKDKIAMNNISNLGYNDLKSRGISKEICKIYGVKSRVDLDGNDLSHYYPQKSNHKTVAYMERRVHDKRFRNIGSFKEIDFFGQDICGSNGKMIIISEGQACTMAAKQMLLKEGKNYRVVSIPNGVNSAVKTFKKNYEWIAGFDSILLAFDMDDPGVLAGIEVGELFPPNKVKIINMSEKDPNDMLLKNKSKEFLRAIFDAKESHPDGIVSVKDLYEEALKPVLMGYSYPWKTLTDATYGYRRRELLGVGGGTASGKTNAFKELIDHTIFVHKLPVGIIFLEEPAAKTLKVLAGKHYNRNFHIPDAEWTEEELKKSLNDLDGMAFFFDHFGSKNWESIKSKIRYMVNALGIKDIYLDHLTALVAQESDEYRALNKIMEELSALTHELNCTIFFISHLSNPKGKAHEEGGQVSVTQFKGSGAIRFWSDFLFGLERNQQALDFTDRNTTTFRVLKDRNTGLATGLTFQLLYDHKIGRWKEIDNLEFDDEEV